MSREQFAAARDRLLAAANVGSDRWRRSGSASCPTSPASRSISTSRGSTALGLTTTDVNSTLSTAWGGRYVNDFIDRGRVKRVYVQGDAPYRVGALRHRRLVRSQQPGADGALHLVRERPAGPTAPVTLEPLRGTSRLTRSTARPRRAEARARRWREIEKLASQIPGVSVAWSGASYQERVASGQAPLLYAVSLIVIFLCLAALYESWSIPLAVLLVVPLGLVGAILFVTLRGLAERRVPADRPSDDDGPDLEERDPDERIRRARGERGQAHHRRRGRSGANPASADPDDQLRLHLRRFPARDRDRARRQRPNRDRHRGHRRHADRDDPRRLLHPALLRPRAPRRSRRARHHPRAHPPPPGGARHEARRRASRAARRRLHDDGAGLCPARSRRSRRRGPSAIPISSQSEAGLAGAHLQAGVHRRRGCRR